MLWNLSAFCGVLKYHIITFYMYLNWFFLSNSQKEVRKIFKHQMVLSTLSTFMHFMSLSHYVNFPYTMLGDCFATDTTNILLFHWEDKTWKRVNQSASYDSINSVSVLKSIHCCSSTQVRRVFGAIRTNECIATIGIVSIVWKMHVSVFVIINSPGQEYMIQL